MATLTIRVNGAKIREKRIDRRLTQTELAHAAGVDQGWLSKIESGRVKTISVKFLRAIEEQLGPIEVTSESDAEHATPLVSP
ncbi:helix-turn-helix transcriptional regulator [Frankia sp. AgB1.9]|uniref:helix-turn-helix domain-containing protein n=1 Tax=unclassified Frankia TaxID=2632575 RepID=UPI0019329CCE|nr:MULTISPECIES: helix-turn-helix transcriptional regulator [unclassified Frankia]MBL7491328.1 helix-turn-helix transcriptional regulator [Frankia sp. AgW1.1]MBL7546606.1 helix-turn-helix transcriptional regulator [Frankia sp. AgB1.9]MBL7624660.1 helix-turn-helix transcriptional regulator [Frankia sp. AgB1.8]